MPGAIVADEWQWDVDAFLAAEEAGLFGQQQVELVQRKVRCVVHGRWHGVVMTNMLAALHRS